MNDIPTLHSRTSEKEAGRQTRHHHDDVQTSVSSLALRVRDGVRLFMRAISAQKEFGYGWKSLALCAIVCGYASAFTQVTVSPSAPDGIEKQFLAQTTTYFDADLVANPLAANTYSLKLKGQMAPIKPFTQMDVKALGDAFIAQSTMTFVYGWSFGAEYQNRVDEKITQSFMVSCSTPTAFSLDKSTSSTFDAATCQDVLHTLINTFYQLNLSTPPVIDGD